MKDDLIELYGVNRVEVIDHRHPVGGGRVYVAWEQNELDVALALQDDGRTLKVFVKDKR